MTILSKCFPIWQEQLSKLSIVNKHFTPPLTCHAFNQNVTNYCNIVAFTVHAIKESHPLSSLVVHKEHIHIDMYSVNFVYLKLFHSFHSHRVF